MLNLYKKLPDNLNKVEHKVGNISYSFAYSFHKLGDDLFIDEVFYYSVSEHTYINAYLNLLIGRGLEVIDRISVKELDYFMRSDNSVSSFDKISKEILQIIEIGEVIKNVHITKAKNENKVYNQLIHGPFEFMSLGEKLELIEEVLAHPFLKDFELECTNVEDKVVYLRSELNLSIQDRLIINDKVKELCLEFLEVNLDV